MGNEGRVRCDLDDQMRLCVSSSKTDRPWGITGVRHFRGREAGRGLSCSCTGRCGMHIGVGWRVPVGTVRHLLRLVPSASFEKSEAPK